MPLLLNPFKTALRLIGCRIVLEKKSTNTACINVSMYVYTSVYAFAQDMYDLVSPCSPLLTRLRLGYLKTWVRGLGWASEHMVLVKDFSNGEGFRVRVGHHHAEWGVLVKGVAPMRQPNHRCTWVLVSGADAASAAGSTYTAGGSVKGCWFSFTLVVWKKIALGDLLVFL